MTTILWMFGIFGFITFGIFGYHLMVEIIRATRQSHRLATAQTRLSLGKRKTNIKYWWTYFKSDFMSYYTTKRIGPYVMNYNPSIKTTKTY